MQGLILCFTKIIEFFMILTVCNLGDMDHVVRIGEDEPKTSGKIIPRADKSANEALYIARRLEPILEELDSNIYRSRHFLLLHCL